MGTVSPCAVRPPSSSDGSVEPVIPAENWEGTGCCPRQEKMTSSTAAVGEPLIEASLSASLGSQDRVWKRQYGASRRPGFGCEAGYPPHPPTCQSQEVI
jgi:hypothetical protein